MIDYKRGTFNKEQAKDELLKLEDALQVLIVGDCGPSKTAWANDVLVSFAQLHENMSFLAICKEDTELQNKLNDLWERAQAHLEAQGRASRMPAICCLRQLSRVVVWAPTEDIKGER